MFRLAVAFMWDVVVLQDKSERIELFQRGSLMVSSIHDCAFAQRLGQAWEDGVITDHWERALWIALQRRYCCVGISKSRRAEAD